MNKLFLGDNVKNFSLHHNLIEHLNAEVVLHTITDVSIALEWLRSTFFYIRVKQNPQHYGQCNSFATVQVNKCSIFLQECQQNQRKWRKNFNVSIVAYSSSMAKTVTIIPELCLRNLQMLESCSLVKMNDGFILEHTGLG